MAVEYELKFRGRPEVFPEILARYPGEIQEYEMETTYYDTPSGALSARRYTLRQRMENGESVCTLKTPAIGYGRQEWELRCDCLTDALPVFCTMGAPKDFEHAIREGIQSICGAKFHRIAITLSYSDCTLELALDQGILTGGGKTVPLCEVEVELKQGQTQAADIFALDLAERYCLLPETQSKFRRALALYKGEVL